MAETLFQAKITGILPFCFSSQVALGYRRDLRRIGSQILGLFSLWDVAFPVIHSPSANPGVNININKHFAHYLSSGSDSEMDRLNLEAARETENNTEEVKFRESAEQGQKRSTRSPKKI